MWLKLKMFQFFKSKLSTWLTHLTLRFLYIFGCSGPRCAICKLLKKANKNLILDKRRNKKELPSKKGWTYLFLIKLGNKVIIEKYRGGEIFIEQELRFGLDLGRLDFWKFFFLKLEMKKNLIFHRLKIIFNCVLLQ